MLLRFDIAITETTKTCPTTVFIFTQHSSNEHTKTRLDKFHLCCISNVPMRQFYGWNVNTLNMQHKWNLPKRFFFVFFIQGMSSNKQNRGWTSLRCLGNCYVTTQQHLYNFQVFTPSNVLEVHSSTNSCWIR